MTLRAVLVGLLLIGAALSFSQAENRTCAMPVEMSFKLHEGWPEPYQEDIGYGSAHFNAGVAFYDIRIKYQDGHELKQDAFPIETGITPMAPPYGYGTVMYKWVQTHQWDPCAMKFVSLWQNGKPWKDTGVGESVLSSTGYPSETTMIQRDTLNMLAQYVNDRYPIEPGVLGKYKLMMVVDGHFQGVGGSGEYPMSGETTYVWFSDSYNPVIYVANNPGKCWGSLSYCNQNWPGTGGGSGSGGSSGDPFDWANWFTFVPSTAAIQGLEQAVNRIKGWWPQVVIDRMVSAWQGAANLGGTGFSISMLGYTMQLDFTPYDLLIKFGRLVMAFVLYMKWGMYFMNKGEDAVSGSTSE